MNIIKDTIEYIKQLFTWWIEIMPWEQGVRVTLGKHQKKLTAGIWLRLPIIHVVYSQPIRFRILETPLQTVTDVNGDVLSLRMAIGYQITDIISLYNSVHYPESAISSTALGISSKLISSGQLNQGEIEKRVLDELQSLNYGINITQCYVTTLAKVKTYRLIGDAIWVQTDGENINIKKP